MVKLTKEDILWRKRIKLALNNKYRFRTFADKYFKIFILIFYLVGTFGGVYFSLK